MGVVGTQIVDALAEDDGRVGAADAREIGDGRDDRVHEPACREARLLGVEMHLVAYRALRLGLGSGLGVGLGLGLGLD